MLTCVQEIGHNNLSEVSMIHSITQIQELQPNVRRSFKAFRGLNAAKRYAQHRIEKGKMVRNMRLSDYSKYTGNVKDRRYVVNT
jgi:hypothetical protein